MNIFQLEIHAVLAPKKSTFAFFDGVAHTDTKNISFKLLFRKGFHTHYSETSKLWKDIATYAETKLTRGKHKLNPKHIARCFLLVSATSFL